MKIDKKTVDYLVSLPDERLWSIIQSLGASSGFDLSGVRVSENQLESIRAALSTMTDSDISRAVEILSGLNGKNQK